MHNLHDIANSPIVITLLGGITIALLRYVFVGKLQVVLRIVLFLFVVSLVIFWVMVALPGKSKNDSDVAENTPTAETAMVEAGNDTNTQARQSPQNSKMKLSVGALSFGMSTNTLTFSIINAGTSGSISWKITDDKDWMSVTPRNGITDANKKSEVSVTVSRSKLLSNIDDVIEITANGETHTISVSVEVPSSNSNVAGEVGLNAGLEIWYTFDNGNADDLSGNKHDASLISSPNFASEDPSGSGKSLYLRKNKKQYVAIPHNPFRGQNSYSVSMWVKDFGQGVLFSAVSNDDLRSDFPRLIAGAEGKLTFYTGYDDDNSTAPFTYHYSPMQDGKWHHIVVVCKETTDGRCLKELYVDRVLMDTAEGSTAPSEHEEPFKVYIGGDSDGRYAFTNNMKVDNIRMYSKGIGAGDVRAINNLEQ